MGTATLAQTNETPIVSIESAEVGIEGCYKLGAWTPIQLVVKGDVSSVASVRTRALDGDGLAMDLDWPITEVNGTSLRCWTRIGRSNSDLVIQLLDRSEGVLAETKLRADSMEESLDAQVSTRRIMLCIGFDKETDLKFRVAAGAQQAGSPIHLVTSDNIGGLPDRWFGYEAFDTVVLSTRQVELLDQWGDAQRKALLQWVELGGRLIIGAARNADALLGEGGAWTEFAPGKYSGTSELAASNSLEFYSRPAQQLIQRKGEPLTIADFESHSGIEEIGQDSNALVIRRSVGLGEVVWAAFDLDDPKFADWNGTTRMYARLLQTSDVGKKDEKQQSGGRVTHYGYDDLAGQLRAPLDEFQGVNFVTFTLVAVLIGIYLLVVGPGDYFFLRHVLRRMEMTWVTFTIVTLLFCVAAWAIVRWSNPGDVRVNQVEVVDVDTATGICRGTMWAHLYSPSSQRFELQLKPGLDPLGIDGKSSILSWQGLAGTGLGGMQTETGLGLLRQRYSGKVRDEKGRLESTLNELPVQVGATKPLTTRWWSRNGTSIESNIRYRPQGERLVGTIRNPFDRPLDDCYLLYDKWAYRFGRLAPGQTVDVADGQERTLKNFLTLRRYGRDSKIDVSTPWNPAGTDIARIVQIMMFYRAAGGSNYTSLENGQHRSLDLSSQLELDRAIFVGRLDDFAATPLQVDGQSIDDKYDKKITVMRFLLPVQRQQRRSQP